MKVEMEGKEPLLLMIVFTAINLSTFTLGSYLKRMPEQNLTVSIPEIKMPQVKVEPAQVTIKEIINEKAIATPVNIENKVNIPEIKIPKTEVTIIEKKIAEVKTIDRTPTKTSGQPLDPTDYETVTPEGTKLPPPKEK